MKKLLFTLLFMSMALSQFTNDIAGRCKGAFYVPDGTVYSEGATVVDEGTLAGESLNEVDFATHLKWDVTNDFDDSGGNAAFIWSLNQTSTLTQIQANLATAGVGSKWYEFTYTLAVTTAFDGDAVATITTSFALSAVQLEIVTAGTYTIYFKSAVTPTNFVISLVSGSDTEGTISYDDVTLKEITGGDIYVAGTANVSTIFAPGSFTLKTGTGTTALIVDSDGKLYMESDGDGAQIILTGKTDATADAILLLSAAGATNVQGLKLWYDRDTACGYIDNLYNNDAGNIYIRTKIAGTPINAMTILGTGNVGIGLTDPDAKLEINGQIKITGGVPGVDKILTSDANGLASWVAAAGGGDFSNGGDVAGAARTLGNTDGYNMGFETNNVERAFFGATTGHFLPNGHYSYDLGAVGAYWNNLYAGIAYLPTLYANGLWHTGDADTKVNFVTDKMELHAGGVKFIEFIEAATDYMSLGESADIDIYANGFAYNYGTSEWKWNASKHIYYDTNATEEHYKKVVTYNATETEVYLDRGNFQWLTFGAGNITTLDFNYGALAHVIKLTLIITQDGTGSRTIGTWDASILWEGGTAPTLITTANSVDIFEFIWDGGTVIYGKHLSTDVR